jgi:hypothetical protein
MKRQLAVMFKNIERNGMVVKFNHSMNTGSRAGKGHMGLPEYAGVVSEPESNARQILTLTLGTKKAFRDLSAL